MTNIRLTELAKRLYWFINIRWLAIAGVIIAINFAKYFQDIPLPYPFLYLVSGVLTIFNIIYLAFYNYIKNNESLQLNKTLINYFANFQALVDLIILSLLLYGSGGIYSPFIYYFAFHMVIAGMLLSPLWAFAQGAIALSFFSILIILSGYHIIPNYSLPGFGPQPGTETYVLFITSRLVGLVSAMFILIFMSTSISRQLNKKEQLLNKLNEELEHANREKSKYILQTTHELKAPLAAIQSYLKVALEGYVGPIEGKLKEMLSNINHRAGNMLLMVNELLDIANIKRIDIKALEKEKCNVNHLVNKVLRLFEDEIAEKKIDVNVKIAENCEVLANIEQFCILLTNIINNAMKYSGTNSSINIEAVDLNGNLQLKISDNGIGIPKKDIPNIFNEYYRAQNAVDRKNEGTGLGLAIVENIVKKHGGCIRVESELEKGTSFIIELPDAAQ